MRQTFWLYPIDIKSDIEAKRSQHVSAKRSTDMLKMCEDCRVEAMFAQNDKTMDVGERRKPRTTDDYMNYKGLTGAVSS